MGLSNPLHIAILVVVLFLVFGHRRIPAMARSLGSTKNEFKAGLGSGPESAAHAAPASADRSGLEQER
jgi:TatA/E family protein of Tat protein translocase